MYKTLIEKLKTFCTKHQKLTITFLLFACVNSCFHGGSKVNQENLSNIFEIQFPPCRASNEHGTFHDLDWRAEGILIFKNIPTEDFYQSIDNTPRKDGHEYTLSVVPPDLSIEAKKILGKTGYLYITIIKGDSVAKYVYGSI